MSSTTSGETHASLALANSPVLRDYSITVRFVNESQLRTPTPNPWETFWLFTNYTVDVVTGKKKTNYIALKTSGIELGTAFDELGQTFLYTSGSPKAVIGQVYEMVVSKTGQHMDVSVNGVNAFSFDGYGSNTLYDVAGQIGLYVEDSRARVYSITAK